jgi:hypothetical protein
MEIEGCAARPPAGFTNAKTTAPQREGGKPTRQAEGKRSEWQRTDRRLVGRIRPGPPTCPPDGGAEGASLWRESKAPTPSLIVFTSGRRASQGAARPDFAKATPGQAATPYRSKFRTFSGNFNEARPNRPEKLDFFSEYSL